MIIKNLKRPVFRISYTERHWHVHYNKSTTSGILVPIHCNLKEILGYCRTWAYKYYE